MEEGVTALYEIGAYWDREVQIDVVGARKDGVIDLGECKCGPVRSPLSAARELESKLARFESHGGATLQRRIFLRAAPKKTPAGTPPIRWHSLAELYGEEA